MLNEENPLVSLQIKIDKVDFNQVNYYYLTVKLKSLPDDLRRTDISAALANPQFLSNTFEFPLMKSKIEANEVAIFEAFCVQEGHGAVLVGFCNVEIGYLNINEEGIKQRLRFIKQNEYGEETIGRFIAEFKLKNLVRIKKTEDQIKKELLEEDNLKEEEKRQITIQDVVGTKLENIENVKEKWNILSKEIAQRQEILHRMQKEITDKTTSLKQIGEEVVELRQHIKILRQQNDYLKKRNFAEEQISLHTIISQEIKMMKVDEVKAKIISVATAFRDQRMRNIEFENAMKEQEKNISKIAQLEVDIADMRSKHQDDCRKLADIQEEVSKKTIYEEAIQKQQKVVAKLENMLENVLKDTEKAKQAQVELRQLQQEVDSLQVGLKRKVYGDERSEVANLRQQCTKLEAVINNLKDEINTKQQQQKQGNFEGYYEGEQVELAIRQQKAKLRVESLNEEMIANAKNFAQEIAKLKLEIAQKQAQLDTLTLTNI